MVPPCACADLQVLSQSPRCSVNAITVGNREALGSVDVKEGKKVKGLQPSFSENAMIKGLSEFMLLCPYALPVDNDEIVYILISKGSCYWKWDFVLLSRVLISTSISLKTHC